MKFRIETDARLRETLGADGPAWAESYLKTRKHHDGDMQRLELASWFDAAIAVGMATGLKS